MQKTAGLSAFPNICFATHQRIPAGIAVLIMVAILLIAPAAPAGTLSGPSSTSANSFTLTWSVSPPAPPPFAWDSGTHAATLEENGNSISPGSGSVTLSRPSGTYNYRIEKCSWYYYYGYTTNCDSATKTVTVSNQPAVPPSVTAFSNSCTSTAVHWGAVASNVSQYRVYEQVNGGSWSQVYAGSRKTASSPLILNRSAQTTYRYRVRADYSAAGYSAVSGYRYSSSIVTPICDADADGVADGTDQCPNTPVGETANASGCSPSQLDSDGDGVTDAADQCPATPVGESVDTDGCAASQLIPTVEQPPAPDLSMPSVSVSAIDQTLSLGGQFNVSPGGQVTYEIPIEAPRGSGGLAPNISLRYNSGAGIGMAGWGWSISGLGSISRCRQTEGHDKNAAPITWSAEDRFCLNGERLLVTSGTYGAPGSTYRTEIDSYARITAIGGTAGHPDYFKVERKDGRVDYYGSDAQGTMGSGNAKHRMAISNVRTYSWLLSRQEDSTSHVDGQGNQITYQYMNTEGSGALPRISAIVYTRGRLHFDWKLRPDKMRGYVSGYSYHNDYRLNYIEISIDGDTLHSYNLSYDESEVEYYDRTSRLVGVDLCNEPDSIYTKCYRGTAFQWNNPRFVPSFQHASRTSLSMFPGGPEQFIRGDINGDGLQDIIWGDSAEVRHSIASLDGNGQLYYPEDTTIGGHPPASPAAKIYMIDYNADGRQDLVVRETYTQYGFTPGIRVYPAIPQSDGSWTLSATPVSESTFLPLSYFDRPIFVDIDGNGLQDVVDERTRKYRLHDSTQYGEYGPARDIVFTHPSNITPCDTLYAHILHPRTGDFNGDGRVDFIGMTQVCDSNNQFLYSHTYIYTSHSLPNGGLELRYFTTLFEHAYRDPDTSEYHPRLVIADLNNDGLSDVFDKYLFYRLSNGKGFEAQVTVPLTAHYEFTSLVDVNADGYLEIIGLGPYLDYYTIRYWDPAVNGYSSDTVQVSSNFSYGLNEVASFTDMNGDGLVDVVLYHPQGGTYNLIVVPQQAPAYHPPHRIRRIFEGGNTLAEIRYENLGQSKHYGYIKGVKSATQEQVCQSTAAGNACWNRPVAASSSTGFYNTINNPFAGLPSGNQVIEDPLLHRVFNVVGSMPVVTEVSRSVPVANPNNPEDVNETLVPVTSYYYEQARMQASGRGFLGFKKVTEVDRRNGLRKETDYRQDWPFSGRPISTTLRNRQGAKLKENTMRWGLVDCNTSCVDSLRATIVNGGIAAASAIRPYMSSSQEMEYYVELDHISDQGPLLVQVERTVDMDNHGNVTSEVEETYDESYELELRKTTTNQYSYSGATWSMEKGRLTHMTTVHTNDVGSITRESGFTYYTSGRQIGLVHTETLEPNNSAYTQITTHAYDDFGNRTQSVVTGGGETRYGPRLEYDAAGRYVDRVYENFNNGSGGLIERLVREVISRNSRGLATETRHYVDANSYRTEWAGATSMGVVYRNYDSSGAWTVTGGGLGVDGGGVCPSGLTDTHQHIRTAGGGESILCFDIRKRKIREATRLFDGSWSRVDTEYDALDRVVRVSEPYVQGQTEYWTEHKSYDPLNRARRIEHPDYPQTGAVTTIAYQGYWTLTTNLLAQTHSEFKNALGQVTLTKDPMNGYTFFTYDARGNLKTMRDPGNNTTTIDYDLLDRKISMDDPDKGFWTYQYNHMGELTCQRDAKGQVIKHSYDFKGRLINRKDYTGGTCASPSGTLESDSVWTYDTAAYGLGQFSIVTDSVSGYEKQITYDVFGRASVTRTRLPGVNGQLENHYEKTTYDQHGRVFQVFDAARADNTFNHNGVQYAYKNGYLHKLIDAVHINGEPRTTYYQVETVDRRGNVTEATYGNGMMQFADHEPATGRITNIWASNGSLNPIQNLALTWDEAGNLTQRHETGLGLNASTPRNLRETFTYDALNRLTGHQLSGTASGTFEIQYDALGNITGKGKVGGEWISYINGNTPQCGLNTRPHAVCETSVSSGSPYYGLNDYDTAYYSYDANGNLLGLSHDEGGTDRYISYYVPDLPKTISKGGHSSQFWYGPDRARFKRVDTAGSNTTTTLYLGSVEKVYNANGSIHWKRSIGGFALITQTVNSSGDILSEDQSYFHKDHLGSINLITDEDGDVTEVLDFDPWGRRRNMQTWQDMSQSARLQQFGIFVPPTTTRGYTEHEMLEEVDLIHMNGRIYDPVIARFVQADPIIQNPYNSQSLNRYSYVWNNPLNATDPSGFECRGSGDAYCQQDAWIEDLHARDEARNRGQHLGEVMANMARAERMMRDSYVDVSIDGVSVNSMSEAGAMASFDHAFGPTGEIEITFLKINVYPGNVEYSYRQMSYLFNSTPMTVWAEREGSRGSLNQEGQNALECKGQCHGVPGLGSRTPISEAQSDALVNTALSGTGAVVAGIGCAGTGVSCGLAAVLATDASRQFTLSLTGTDPLIDLATGLGATDLQAANIALGADFLTGVISINGAYKGLFFNYGQFTAGVLGTTSLDIFSTINTVDQLNKNTQ